MVIARIIKENLRKLRNLSLIQRFFADLSGFSVITVRSCAFSVKKAFIRGKLLINSLFFCCIGLYRHILVVQVRIDCMV